MRNRIFLAIFTIMFAVSINAFAQGKNQTQAVGTPPRPTPAPQAMQTLTGVIRVHKEMGVIPHSKGSSQPGTPCGQFYVAVLDPAKNNKTIALSHTEKGNDQGEYYTCRYSLTAPANRSLYVVAGLGGSLLLPKTDRDPMLITDAWVGGNNNKPRRGWERGFAGKFVTLGNKAVYLKFDMQYAQVDPN